MSGKGCPEDADGKFQPNQQERRQQRCTKEDSVPGFFNLPQYKLTQQARACKQHSSNYKIECRPFHFMAELHRNKGEEQEYGDCEHDAGESFILYCHEGNVLSMKSKDIKSTLNCKVNGKKN